MSSRQADLAIIGGGIIGLATGYRFLERYPGRKLVLLEKEPQLAFHQTGHNSGVIHSGIYYRPGSLRATNCRAGRLALEEFCRQEEVAVDICGKVIVAVTEDEVPRLKNILDRGLENGIRCELIDGNRLRELEPHVAGVQAIHVPEAGIVDYPGVCRRLAARIEERGGEILTSARVRRISHVGGRVQLQSTAGDVESQLAVNCSGLHADRVARLSGAKPTSQIVPFRGEYFELKPEAEHLCRNLIYPVPDPRFPFLGVHFTRMALGGVECGPNAVLAFAREGYRKTDINLRDLTESLTYPGFLRMAARYWKTGLGEMWRSVSKGAFVKALQRLMPEIRAEHMVWTPAGVRAQALARSGNLVDDFLIEPADRVINVLNAPSPAATASLNIGSLIVDRVAEQL